MIVSKHTADYNTTPVVSRTFTRFEKRTSMIHYRAQHQDGEINNYMIPLGYLLKHQPDDPLRQQLLASMNIAPDLTVKQILCLVQLLEGTNDA